MREKACVRPGSITIVVFDFSFCRKCSASASGAHSSLSVYRMNIFAVPHASSVSKSIDILDWLVFTSLISSMPIARKLRSSLIFIKPLATVLSGSPFKVVTRLTKFLFVHGSNFSTGDAIEVSKRFEIG